MRKIIIAISLSLLALSGCALHAGRGGIGGRIGMVQTAQDVG